MRRKRQCKRESLKSFSDDRVLIEKYITKPRHIEVQIFGDMMKIMFIYTREIAQFKEDIKSRWRSPIKHFWSHQSSICQSAVEAAKAVGYYNAGTVELIFDLDSNKHFFMEWTRDFKLSIRFLNKLPVLILFNGNFSLQVDSLFLKSKIKFKKGNAIEVRIYSEDPFNNFLPNHGKLKYFK